MITLQKLSTDALSPDDWKQLAKASLSGGEILHWKIEFAENCQRTAEQNAHANDAGVNYEMLARKGPYAGISQQLMYNPGVYEQNSTTALKAWGAYQNLSKIRHGPDKPFQEFVD